MKKATAPLLLSIALANLSYADEQTSIADLQAQVKELNEKLEMLAEAVDSTPAQQSESRIHFGGYGELNYNHLDVDGEDQRSLDFRRWVLFVGYDFSDSIRFHSEVEIEHTVVPGSDGDGAVELEQAYIEMDLSDSQQLKTGIILTPVGIINETHEPVFYYGTERPVIETTVIPTTWYVGGIMYSQNFSNGISYDIMISEGLKTEDPTTDADAEPFNLKAGKQKTSNADVFDLATTARIKYTGIAGLELSAYAQYQPDLDQSAADSYADSATLLGGHVIYQWRGITAKALYARWDLEGDEAAEAEQDVQEGGYAELSWKPAEQWGIFARQSNWTLQTDVDAAQTDFGFSYFPHPDVVFKADYQLQNDDAGNADGFNLGMGYQF
ncbi:MAG: hypothetical protein KYX62_05185 [Pseudomonadota bacterium]|nr:hypothetical protein [Pseudomonadota bacterium]